MIDIGLTSFLRYVSFRQGYNNAIPGKEVDCLKKKKSVKKIAEIEYNEFPPEEDNILDDFCTVASTTECTGLMPNLPQTYAEEESYTKIYTIPAPSLRRTTEDQQNPGDNS